MNESSWFSFCDGNVQKGGQILHLEYLESLNAVLAISNENNLKVFDATSGATLQENGGSEAKDQKLRCCYHKNTGNVTITNGNSVGYRSHNNGILLVNTALQAAINSQMDIVTLELPISEARLLTNFIQDTDLTLLAQNGGDDMKAKEDAADNVEAIEDVLDILVKQISNSDESDKVTPSGKWTTVKISQPYSVLKSACQTLLLCHQRYVQSIERKSLIPGYHQPRHSAYGLPIVSSMLHQLVLLFPADNPGCHGATMDAPSRELMYSELTRRTTFAKWPHPDYKYALPHAMAEAGFYHQPAATGDDRAMCFACNVCLVCWEPSDEPWSEHERHSPSCPFVCCEPTVNVPISVTHATLPAMPNPFPTTEGSKVKPTVDLMCIGENSNLLVAASKYGMLATWDLGDMTPKLSTVCNISKSNILYLLRHRLKQNNFPHAGRLVSANYLVSDLTITSLHVLDKLPAESELVTCDPQEFLTTLGVVNKDTEQKLATGGATATPQNISLSKIPNVVVGVTVQVNPRPFRGTPTRSFKSPQPPVEPPTTSENTEATKAPSDGQITSESPAPVPRGSPKKDPPLFQTHKFSLLLFLKPEKSQTGKSAKVDPAKQQLTMSKTTLFQPQSMDDLDEYPEPSLSNNIGTMSIPQHPPGIGDEDSWMHPETLEMHFGLGNSQFSQQQLQQFDLQVQEFEKFLPKSDEILGDMDSYKIPNLIDLTQDTEDDVMDSFVENVVNVDENANVQVTDAEKTKPEQKEKLESATILQLVVIDHCRLGQSTSQSEPDLQIINNILTTEDGQKLLITTCPEGSVSDPTHDTPIAEGPMKTQNDIAKQDTPQADKPEKMQAEIASPSGENGSDLTDTPPLEEPMTPQNEATGDTPNTPPAIEPMESQNENTSQTTQQTNDDAQETSQNTEAIVLNQGKEQPIIAEITATPTSDPPIESQEKSEVRMETSEENSALNSVGERFGQILIFDVEPSHSVHCVSPKEMTPADEGTKWMKTSPVLQISNFPSDFSRAAYEDDEADSMDGEEDEQQIKENNQEERVEKNDGSTGGIHALTLNEEGNIQVLDVEKMDFVYKTKPSQVFLESPSDATKTISETPEQPQQDTKPSAPESRDAQMEKFTAFVYCSGTERVCVSTSTGKLVFLKIGKHSSLPGKDSKKSTPESSILDATASTSSAGQDQVDGAKTASGKLKLTSSQLFVNQPLTTENLKNLVGLTKSEPLKPRFTATAPVCWREVPLLEQGPGAQHSAQAVPQQMKAALQRKKLPGLSQPAVMGQQQLQGRRHLRHPNEHFPEHTVSFTRAWRLQPDCLSWREHFFELVLPRATNVSHIDLKFVLTRKLKPGADIQVTLLKHPGLSSSKREVLQSARKKWRHQTKIASPSVKKDGKKHTSDSGPSFSKVMHLLTEGFVESLMDVDIENPVLLVVEEKESDTNVQKYVMMDGSRQTIVAICKKAPPELTVGHLVVIKGYMRVKVGVSNVRIIVAALKICTEEEIASMHVDEIKSMEEDWSSFETSYDGKKQEKQQQEGEDQDTKQLFDPIKDLQDHEWFHGAIPRQVANNLLQNDGDFLLRESPSSPGDFFLSVLHEGNRKHFTVNTHPIGKFKFGIEERNSVVELVQAHYTEGIMITPESGCYITNPILKSHSAPAFYKVKGLPGKIVGSESTSQVDDAAVVEESSQEDPSATEEAEEEDPDEGLVIDRSSVLFGPVNLSDYVDASGIGGIVTITSRSLVKDSRHRAVLLHIEDANAAANGTKKFVGIQSDEWRKRGCNRLQEISVVINKAHRLNISHERVQRFSVMCSRSLHTKLLSRLCDEKNLSPPSGETFVRQCLPQKIAALDVLNWVASLEAADPNERNLIGDKEKNSTNTVAATRALSPAQTLTWLVCFSDGNLKKVPRDKKGPKTVENLPKLEKSEEKISATPNGNSKVEKITESGKILPQGVTKYSLRRFLESCFLHSGRDISMRALRLIFNTVLSIDVHGKTTNVSGTQVLCEALIECLQNALEKKIPSAYGMHCLFQILGVVMASEAQIGKGQSSEFMTLVEKCVSALSKASFLMKESIHPLHAFLRAEHGLYGTPFDPDRFTIEFVVNGNKNVSPSSGPMSMTDNLLKQQNWERYFSNEELNIQDLVTPKILSVRRGLAVGDFVDGLSVSRFGLIECQPLHFTCIDTSEGCTVRVDSETDSESIIASASAPDIPHQDAKGAKSSAMIPNISKILSKNNNPLLVQKLAKSMGKAQAEVAKLVDMAAEDFASDDISDILECYVEPKDGESGSSGQAMKTSYVEKMQQDMAPKRSLPTFMDTSESAPPETEERPRDPTDGSKAPLNITIPDLSFALPPTTTLTMSRIHSGARRRVVLDFGHTVEITDINIPSCPDLSSIILDARSEARDTGTNVVTHIGIALDICDHDFVLCNLSPPIVCRYLLITAIGRYGTTNAQTVVNLGRFYGRPACVGHRKPHPSTNTQNEAPSPPKKSMKEPDEDRKSTKEGRPVLVDSFDLQNTVSGRTALQKSLVYLRTYQDDILCRYSLACNELNALLSNAQSRHSSQVWVVGDFSLQHNGLGVATKKITMEKLLSAYKKCSRLQVQRRRLYHAICHMESISGTAHNTPTFVGSHPFSDPPSQSYPDYTQLQTYCELMLNTLLSLPHGVYFAPQNDRGALELAASKEALINPKICGDFFENLVCNGNPRLRVQTVCLLLSFSSPFSWWGSFLCQTLELAFSGVNSDAPSLPQEHLFATLLALGQRSLAVPQKAENVIKSLLDKLQCLLTPVEDDAVPQTAMPSIHVTTATIDLNLLTWILLYMSHLTETVMSQNECFMSDATPQMPVTDDITASKKRQTSTAMTTTNAVTSSGIAIGQPPIMPMMPLPPPSMMDGGGGIIVTPTGSFPVNFTMGKTVTMPGVSYSGPSANVSGTSSPKLAKAPGNKPVINTKEMRFKNRWNFVSISKEEGNKNSAERSGFGKVLTWMQAINAKLKHHKAELLKLFKEKSALMKKAKNIASPQDPEATRLQAKIMELTAKASEHHRSIISYRRSLDRKMVYNQLQKVKPQDNAKGSDALPFPSAFVNVSVEACRAVVKHILSLLLRLDFTVPSDFVVLACKVASQLSRWCSAQCIHTGGHRSPEEGSKGTTPPLFLSELLSHEEMKKFFLLSVGGTRAPNGAQKNAPEPPVGHPAGPWVNHALVSLLQDLIESENTAMSSCETELFPSVYSPWAEYLAMECGPSQLPGTSTAQQSEETPKNVEKLTEKAEEPEISETEAEENMKNTEYSSRMELVDNFIKLSEEFLTDIKMFMRARGEETEDSGGKQSTVSDHSTQTGKDNENTSTVPMSKTQLYKQMRSLLSDGPSKSPSSSKSSNLDLSEGHTVTHPMAAFLQNIRLAENGGQKSTTVGANRQLICSHIYDTRNVHGVSQHVELTLKLCTMGHLKLLSKSITHPPTAIAEDNSRTEESMESDVVNLPTPLSSFMMLQKCIRQVLQETSTHTVPLTTLCELILMLQETYKDSLDTTLDIVGGDSLVLLADDGTRALLSAVDSVKGCHSNPLIWSLALDLLATYMNDHGRAVQLVENLQLLLSSHFGLENFFVNMLSCKMAATNVGTGHFNKGTSLLGPPICAQLKKLLEQFETSAGFSEVFNKSIRANFKDLRVELRNFLIFVIHCLCERDAFAHTSDTPTDGQLIVVEALLKLIADNRAKMEMKIWSKDIKWILKIIQNISDNAYSYLTWSETAVKGDSERGVDPTSCMGGLFTNFLPSATSLPNGSGKADSPRDTLMLKLLKLCQELTELAFMVTPPKKTFGEKSPQSDSMETAEEESSQEPMELEPEAQEMEVDGSKKAEEQQPKKGKFSNFGEILLIEGEILQKLMGALALCTGSGMASLMSAFKITPTLAIEKSATSTGDGVFLLLATVFENATDPSAPVKAILNYLAGSAYFEGRYMPQATPLPTSQLSLPLLWLILSVLEKSSSVSQFLSLGGARLITDSLVASARESIDQSQGRTSQVLKYLTAATDRASAFAPKPPVVLHNEANWPVLGSGKPMQKVTAGGQGFNYPPLQGAVNAGIAGPAPSVKIFPQPWKENKEFDFAAIATIECSDFSAPPADSLLKPRAVHRRSRSPLWSYHFPEDSHWVSLTLHFPTAFVLRKVKLQPMMLSLSTSPSIVLLEINRSGSPSASAYQPVSVPMVTSGIGDIVINPPADEIASSIRINMKRPVDSSSIGLTKIVVNGVPNFMSYDATSTMPTIGKTVSKPWTSLNVMMSDDKKNKKSTMYWLRLMHHCLTLEDRKLAPMFHDVIIEVEGLIPTLCALLERPVQSNYVSTIETVLLQTGIPEKVSELIGCILKGSSGSRSSHFLGGFSRSSSESTINLLHALCGTEDQQQLELRLKEMLKWVSECASVGPKIQRFTSINADPAYIHAIACGLWKCGNTTAAKNCVNLDLTKIVFHWSQMVQPRHYSMLLRSSLDWLLCAFCSVNTENYYAVLDWMGLTNTQASSISLSNSQIDTLAAVSQTKECIKILGTQGIVQLFSNGLQRFCHVVLEAYQIPHETTVDNVEAALEVTPNNVTAVIGFFSCLCNLSLVQEWLGTEEGAKTWQILLKTLYHVMLITNQQYLRGSSNHIISRSLLLQLQESTISLLKQVTKCNEHNQQLFTRALCDIVSVNSDKSQRMTQLSGFVRSLLLRIVLEDEQYTVSMVSATGQKLHKGNSNSSVSGSALLRHPAFGTGHLTRTFEVGVSSTLKEVWNLASEQVWEQQKGKAQVGLKQKSNESSDPNPKMPTGASVAYMVPPPPPPPSSSYASAVKPVKLSEPSWSAADKYDELFDVLVSGKNAQQKRKPKSGNAADSDTDGAKSAYGAAQLIKLKSPDLGDENLAEDVTLLKVLAMYKAQNVQSFWRSLTLHFHSSVSNPSQDGTKEKEVAMETSETESSPSTPQTPKTKPENTQEASSSDKTEGGATKEITPLKTMLEVFAGLGGLALVAERLPTVTLDIGHASASYINEAKPAEPTQFGPHSDPYGHYGSTLPGCWVDDDDWFGFDDDLAEYHDAMPYTGISKVGPKIPVKMPQPPSLVGSGAGNPCVPAHTMSALCLFLQVPHFAEEFLSDQRPARCLLRLMLGVQDDGQGEQILKLSLAQSLPMLPFTAICSLLSRYDPTSEPGLAIREAMTFDTTSIHLVLACLSRFTHNEPNEDTAAGRLLSSLLPEQDAPPINVAPPSYKGATQAQTAAAKRVNFANKQGEKNYWAKGTGFGTGSTSSDWDVGHAVKKQKKDEGYITVLLEVLANFVCPETKSKDGESAESEENKRKSLPMDGKFATALPELLCASGLIPAIASYLRNDSVLDMAHHVPLYCSLLSVIRSFAVCPVLCRLLMDSTMTTRQPQDGSSTTSATDSILSLLSKMRKCIDTYASRLKAINTSLDSQGEEGLTTFVRNVQKTESMLSRIAKEIKSKDSQKAAESPGKSSDSEPLSESIRRTLSAQSLEKRYVDEMKNLQFDTAELVLEKDDGTLKFPSGHHYSTHIKEAANVTDAARARRLAQETVTLSNSLPLSHSSTVFVRCDEERLDVMKVLITGPSETPYANGCFEFDIFFPTEYNFSPPLVNLRTTGNHSVRFNPNLYNDGKVCLSILNTWHGRPEEKWDPQTSSFLQILVSIQSLILVSEPYFNEPGYERSRGTPAGEQSSREYDANIQQATVRWAMLDQVKNPSPCFKDVIQYHFWLKRDEILAQCDKWTEDMKKRANERHGRRTIAHNYTALQRHVTQLKQELVKMKCPEGLEDMKVKTAKTEVGETEKEQQTDTPTSSTSTSLSDNVEKQSSK